MHGTEESLDDVFCNRSVEYLVTYSLLCSDCDVVGLDEALEPRVCIYRTRAPQLAIEPSI